MDARTLFPTFLLALCLATLTPATAATPQCGTTARNPVYDALEEKPGNRPPLRVRLQAAAQSSLRMTLQRGRECLAVCQSTMPIQSEALRTIDFRCESAQLGGFEAYGALSPIENRLKLGSYLSGYQEIPLRQVRSELASLIRAFESERAAKQKETAARVETDAVRLEQARALDRDSSLFIEKGPAGMR